MAESLNGEAARHVLALTIDPEIQARVEVLAERANEGELTPEERSEYLSYVEAADLLAIFKLKARRHRLQRHSLMDAATRRFVRRGRETAVNTAWSTKTISGYRTTSNTSSLISTAELTTRPIFAWPVSGATYSKVRISRVSIRKRAKSNDSTIPGWTPGLSTSSFAAR